jgi:hypothetical protein
MEEFTQNYSSTLSHLRPNTITGELLKRTKVISLKMFYLLPPVFP